MSPLKAVGSRGWEVCFAVAEGFVSCLVHCLSALTTDAWPAFSSRVTPSMDRLWEWMALWWFAGAVSLPSSASSALMLGRVELCGWWSHGALPSQGKHCLARGECWREWGSQARELHQSLCEGGYKARSLCVVPVTCWLPCSPFCPLCCDLSRCWCCVLGFSASEP